MTETDNTTVHEGRSPLWMIVVAVIFMAGTAYMLVSAHQRLGAMEAALETVQTEQHQVGERVTAIDSRMQATNDTVVEKLGVTQQELQAKTEQLLRQQRAAVNRLAKEQKAVKGEVETVKTDIATTRTDLDATRTRLDSAVGDLGMQSGLIARTREELDELRRRGEKDYHEFTLLKGQPPVRLATVSLQLKKADAKRSKFTLNVFADDRKVEKKDKTILEPLQFYTGKDRHLYELVVFSVEKNKVSGYLATPKVVVATK